MSNKLSPRLNRSKKSSLTKKVHKPKIQKKQHKKVNVSSSTKRYFTTVDLNEASTIAKQAEPRKPIHDSVKFVEEYEQSKLSAKRQNPHQHDYRLKHLDQQDIVNHHKHLEGHKKVISERRKDFHTVSEERKLQKQSSSSSSSSESSDSSSSSSETEQHQFQQHKQRHNQFIGAATNNGTAFHNTKPTFLASRNNNHNNSNMHHHHHKQQQIPELKFEQHVPLSETGGENYLGGMVFDADIYTNDSSKLQHKNKQIMGSGKDSV
eukprot:UN04599